MAARRRRSSRCWAPRSSRVTPRRWPVTGSTSSRELKWWYSCRCVAVTVSRCWTVARSTRVGRPTASENRSSASGPPTSRMASMVAVPGPPTRTCSRSPRSSRPASSPRSSTGPTPWPTWPRACAMWSRATPAARPWSPCREPRLPKVAPKQQLQLQSTLPYRALAHVSTADQEAREYVMTDATATTQRRRPPAPVSISEQAQQFLNTASPFDQVQQPEPYPDDTQGWLRWVATREAPGREMLSTLTPPDHLLARTEVELDGVPTYVLRPNHVAEDSEAPIVLEIHGGALIMGGGDLAWMMAAGKAADRNGSTWVPDYRMP